jgi:hypothetical protein
VNQNNLWLIISLIVLAVFFAAWIYKRIRIHRAHEWPMGHGKVAGTQVRLEGSGTQSSAFIAIVTYSYSVDDVAHSGNLRRRFMRKNSADKWAETYQVGRSLAVRYNPANARDSVLLETEQSKPPG